MVLANKVPPEWQNEVKNIHQTLDTVANANGEIELILTTTAAIDLSNYANPLQHLVRGTSAFVTLLVRFPGHILVTQFMPCYSIVRDLRHGIE